VPAPTLISDSDLTGLLKNVYANYREKVQNLETPLVAQLQKARSGLKNMRWGGNGVYWDVVTGRPAGGTVSASGYFPPDTFAQEKQANSGVARAYVTRQIDGLAFVGTKTKEAAFETIATKTLSEIPISYVTNGVHAPTWIAPLLRSLYEKHVGEDWQTQLQDRGRWEKGIAQISDQELWSAHSLLKQRLVAFVRYRSFLSRHSAGEDPDYAEAARTMFDASALTIGFARRIAGYKRWDLLLTDPERLLRLINNEQRPVQFVFAGKAHPQDEGSKSILQHLAQWKYDPRVRQRAVFVEDYDQEIARQLVQSVDVWLNVPRRPLEASGTSGEKVAVNGGQTVQVTRKGGFAAIESSDGQTIYYAKTRFQNPEIWQVATQGGTETLVSPLIRPGIWANWAATQRGILFLSDDGAESHLLQFFDFATRTAQPIGTLDGPSFWLSASSDGKSAWYTQGEQGVTNATLR